MLTDFLIHLLATVAYRITWNNFEGELSTAFLMRILRTAWLQGFASVKSRGEGSSTIIRACPAQ